jgi:phytoene desaturase
MNVSDRFNSVLTEEPTGFKGHTTRFESRDRAGCPRAVVIGAGLGGLSAAIHLARRGWKVDVVERNARSGGRMNVIEEDGFKIDMGPTMLMMPEVLETLFATCGRDLRDYLTLQRLDPAYRIVWPDGGTLEMGGSMDDLIARARVHSPADADRIPQFIEKMRGKYENARYNFIEQHFNSLRDMVRPSTLRGLIRSLPLESVYQFVSKHLHNEKLRQAFTFQTLYLGMSPYECPSIYALLPYIETKFGVWFPEGGTIAVADALERLLRELGGELHFCRPVERILLDGRRATGVRTSDGEDWPADVVVCNMDAPMAYRRLLPAEARRKHTDERLARRDYGCSGYLLYLGVRRVESDWVHNTIVLSDDYQGILDDICIKKILPRDPAMHVCIPTRTDPSLAPTGHDVVYVLVPCPNTLSDVDWEREAPALRERVLDKLEATGLPGLRSKIVFERAYTPPEFERQYGCYAGAAFSGLTPAFLQSAYFRPHCRSEDIGSLYFVGASTHPGGGVPIVLTSGRLAAEEILQRTGK